MAALAALRDAHESLLEALQICGLGFCGGLGEIAELLDLRIEAGTVFPDLRGGLGLAVVSTSQGLMAGHEARRKNIGGEVICEVW